jgi:hypothetical protein
MDEFVLTERTTSMLELYWKTYNLDDRAKQQLRSFFREEMRAGHKWMPNILEIAVKKATKQAKGLAKKHRKPEIYYLDMALRNKWIENWYRSMGL